METCFLKEDYKDKKKFSRLKSLKILYKIIQRLT